MTSQLWFQILTVYTKLRYEEKQKQVLELMFQRRVLEQTRTVRLYKYIYCFFFSLFFIFLFHNWSPKSVVEQYNMRTLKCYTVRSIISNKSSF